MTARLAFAFLAGGVATANPCGFGLLLAYIARQLGVDGSERPASGACGRALVIGGATTIGFLVVFGIAGTAISLTGGWLIGVVPWAALLVGAALVLTGAFVARGGHVGPRSVRRAVVAGEGPRAAAVFGALYGICSIACTLPIFLVVVALASTAGPSAGAATFVAYALGMGTVLTALALAVALARGGLARAIGRLLPHLTRASGVLLMLAGLYVIYYWAFALGGVPGGGPWAAPLDWVSALSSSVQTWLSGAAGWRLMSWLLAGIAGAGAGLVLWWLLGVRLLAPARGASAASLPTSAESRGRRPGPWEG